MPHDFLGNQITLGANIVYPGRKGSHMWLSKAQVIDYVDFNRALLVRRLDGRTVTLRNVNQVVVVG